MTKKMYLRSSELCGTTIITDVGNDPRPYICLRETWFHPQGGGQQGDKGRIGTCHVIDTRHGADGAVHHFVDSLAGLAAGDHVEIEVDREHRNNGARHHSGGHLIADAMVFLRPSYRAVAGHHWVGEARVEFEVIDGTTPAEPTIDELQERLDELTASDLEFKIEGDPDKGRAIKIGDFAAVGCGGTHVHSTNELAGIRVTGIKNKKGRLRVSYEVASPGR